MSHAEKILLHELVQKMNKVKVSKSKSKYMWFTFNKYHIKQQIYFYFK